MSGSGATVFGLFADPEDADRAAATMTQAHRAWVDQAHRSKADAL
jgi:4-diphosphocytidyl-2C-methyl-D-erythritol kinase